MYNIQEAGPFTSIEHYLSFLSRTKGAHRAARSEHIISPVALTKRQIRPQTGNLPVISAELEHRDIGIRNQNYIPHI